jgi:hypothetical protein
MKKTVTMIDPPSGWKYGFPKPIPDPRPEDMTEWFFENGYPRDKVKLLEYCRMWIQEIDDEDRD